VCVLNCAQLLHTILNRTDPDNFPSHPPDNYHCSDDVYLREGGSAREPASPGWLGKLAVKTDTEKSMETSGAISFTVWMTFLMPTRKQWKQKKHAPPYEVGYQTCYQTWLDRYAPIPHNTWTKFCKNLPETTNNCGRHLPQDQHNNN